MPPRAELGQDYSSPSWNRGWHRNLNPHRCRSSGGAERRERIQRTMRAETANSIATRAGALDAVLLKAAASRDPQTLRNLWQSFARKTTRNEAMGLNERNLRELHAVALLEMV